jgi:hypothetical protein
MAHWQSICQRRQAITDRDNLRENTRWVPHTYSVGDFILIHRDTHGKLAKPTRGPYWLIDVARQHVNGTIVVDLNHSHETFNIRWLIPFKPRQNHWGHDLSYHVPHPSQLNTQSSGLSQFRVITVHAEPLRKSTHFLHQYTSPFTMLPSVLFYKEGLYIFMQHSSKHWRGSPFTGLPHHDLVRVGVNSHIYFNSHSFHSTLFSTSLFNSVCHTAVPTKRWPWWPLLLTWKDDSPCLSTTLLSS